MEDQRGVLYLKGGRYRKSNSYFGKFEKIAISLRFIYIGANTSEAVRGIATKRLPIG